MSIVHSQPPSGNAVVRLLQSAWRYKGLIATVVLLGALLGYGWVARQPTHYEGAARVATNECPPTRFCKVDVPQDSNVLTIRVVDSTAKGAAQLADAVAAASSQIVNGQSRAAISQLRRRFSQLETRSVKVNSQLARHPNDPRLRAQRKAVAHQLSVIRQAMVSGVPWLEPAGAAVPEPIPPSRGRPIAIGMLVGLLASAVLVWWRTRRQGPTSRSSTPEQGPEMPSPA